MSEIRGMLTREGKFLFRFGMPTSSSYACRFRLDRNGEIQREFFDLGLERRGDGRAAAGEYEVEAGDVIEEAHNAPRDGEHGSLHIVSPSGQRWFLAVGMAEIHEYLRGERAAEDMVDAYARRRFAQPGGWREQLEAEAESLRERLDDLWEELETVERMLAAGPPPEEADG